MTNITSEPAANLETKIQRAYTSLRAAILARKHELSQEAGALALKFVLAPTDTASRDQAILLKYEISGLDIALDRIDGEWRCRESLQRFPKAARTTLMSTRDFYKQEAEQYCLRIVDCDPAGTQYAEGHTQAMRSHHAHRAHEYLLAQFVELFTDVLQVMDEPT